MSAFSLLAQTDSWLFKTLHIICMGRCWEVSLEMLSLYEIEGTRNRKSLSWIFTGHHQTSSFTHLHKRKRLPVPQLTPSCCLLGECQALLAGCLQVLGIVVVGGAQVNPVMSLGCFDGFLPLVGGLVELVQEVIASAILVQPLCVLLGGEEHPKSRQPQPRCMSVTPGTSWSSLLMQGIAMQLKQQPFSQRV